MRPIDADALYERAYQLNLDYIVSDVELRMIKSLLDHAPTIEERKKGRWIKNDFYEDALMCSCCNAYLDKEDWGSHYFYFCYHCGAFMEGMDVEEEKTDDEIH